MASNDQKSSVGSTLSGDNANEDRDATFANTQDRPLLQALQDLIVRVVDPKQTSNKNLIHLEPEAVRLIAALQDFISIIVVRSQSVARNTTIEVSLSEEENEFRGGDIDDDGPDNKSPGKGPNTSSEPEEDEIEIGNNNLDHLGSSEKIHLMFQKKLLRALQEHVFNAMPIRLLCFEPHGSNFRITLLERGAIYERLASVLQGKMDEEFQREYFNFYLSHFSKKTDTSEEGINQLVSKYAQYAILSHTWLRTPPSEVTYGDWNKGLLDAKDPGYQKIVNFCRTAWKDHQLTLGWMDTVCINKESSSELDESIRSMYSWYCRATVCIVYLAETGTLSNMRLDPWFTRGWTLQELFAPRVIKFCNNRWKQLANHSTNDKEDREITNQIWRATTIFRDELKNIRDASISRRMQLAAAREVTREDTAYSLMGIFGVSFSTAYGEGAPCAFFRLLQEILVSSPNILDIFNCAREAHSSPPRSNNSRILPSSPKAYINRSSGVGLQLRRPIEPLTLTHLGLRIPVILMPGVSIWNTAAQNGPTGSYSATVEISPAGHYDHIPTIYNLLDNRISGKDGWVGVDWYQMTFAVFNFGGARNAVRLPITCVAIGLQCREVAGKVSTAGEINLISTNKPIVFELRKGDKEPDDWFGWQIELDRLPKHGMQLTTLYL